MTVEHQFNQARAALRAGQRDEALRQLTTLVREHPDYVLGWLWLSEVIDDPHHRRECLQRVLKLEPTNAVAKQGLLILDMQQLTGQTPPPTSEQNASIASKRLGEYLVGHHFITQQQLDVALNEQTQESRYGRAHALGDILLKRRWITVQALSNALQIQREARAKEGINSITRLGDYLVQSKVITQTQLDQVIARQADLKRRGQHLQIGELLVLSGMVSRQQLDRAIEEQKHGFHYKLEHP